MNFLANENIPLDTVNLLRRSGHEVVMIVAECPGMKDIDVLKRAVHDKSILLLLKRTG
ncbi:MAG: DUF5615 family PIN-like protein [Candidatus Omnitrophica bacterium]|nr:DUF5615 family PIN-like protein [Candidatus Omnitrophota bacterium]